MIMESGAGSSAVIGPLSRNKSRASLPRRSVRSTATPRVLTLRMCDSAALQRREEPSDGRSTVRSTNETHCHGVQDGTTSDTWLPHSSCRSSYEPAREHHNTKVPLVSGGACSSAEECQPRQLSAVRRLQRLVQTMDSPRTVPSTAAQTESDPCYSDADCCGDLRCGWHGEICSTCQRPPFPTRYCRSTVSGGYRLYTHRYRRTRSCGVHPGSMHLSRP